MWTSAYLSVLQALLSTLCASCKGLHWCVRSSRCHPCMHSRNTGSIGSRKQTCSNWKSHAAPDKSHRAVVSKGQYRYVEHIVWAQCLSVVVSFKECWVYYTCMCTYGVLDHLHSFMSALLILFRTLKWKVLWVVYSHTHVHRGPSTYIHTCKLILHISQREDVVLQKGWHGCVASFVN